MSPRLRRPTPARRRPLALAYGCGLRRSEVVGIDVADLDQVSGELRVGRGKGQEAAPSHPATLGATRPFRIGFRPGALEPGPLFCPVLKSGRLASAGDDLYRLSPAAAWRICRERGLEARIQAPASHDLRRSWIGDLLDLGVDLATVQKMAGHASASTTAAYDRRDRGVQRRAAALHHVPYVTPED